MRTLHEDAKGFHVERHKRRNLLNSAGSDTRPGTLGYRRNARGLTDTHCIMPDGTTTIMPRRVKRSRVTAPTTPQAAFTPCARYYAPPRHGLERYIPYLDRFPNVVKLYRLRPTSARTIEVSLGSGRGW